ncbi:esterase family protein [Skermania piniformis]|uniref:Acyl-CoA:diacylglycerol acyltransferase n=2 Tax=Skermania pinensis TaxID=39122 RepID=A0ABX8SEE6_9ACTN|nr:alpha/beta hydrolase family protein [Skermania piniformis]QXQ14056.1 esterase family protein [Skermania piniformis]
MRVSRRMSHRSSWVRRAVLAIAMAMLAPLGLAAVHAAPTANAAFNPSGFDFWANDANGVPLKSRIFRAADGNTARVVYALDGLRARTDLNGWEIETDIANALTRANINVVMPVGGECSFYSDWEAPSEFGFGSSSGSSQKFPYRMETFITRDLPNALAARLGFSQTRNGIFGLSMGGSAALTLAAYHPNQFSYAGSFSGYLNISAPGMKEAMRLAFLDQNGYNIDAMWGPPWDPNWLRNDPFVFAPRLRDEGIRLYIASGSGIPGMHDQPRSFVDLYNTGNAMGLEAIALANTRAFQVRLASLGYNNVTYDYPPVGTHSWPWWADNVYRMLPDLSAHIG